MANLPGWPYWKVVSITGQAGAGTDYQVKFEIGDSAGGDVHLEGHCDVFPQDIRFTDDDGTTLLDHWVEDLTADPIVVRVEVKDDLGSNRDIRIYYGKSGETTASNGANTFIRYAGAHTSSWVDTKDFDFSSGFLYEAKIHRDDAASRPIFGLSDTVAAADDGNNAAFIRFRETIDIYLHSLDAGVADYVPESTHVPQTGDYYIKITYVGTALNGYFQKDNYPGNNQIASGIIVTSDSVNTGMYYRDAGGNGGQYFSYLRKYNSPEPAFSSAGAEQSADLVSVFIRHNPALTGGMV